MMFLAQGVLTNLAWMVGGAFVAWGVVRGIQIRAVRQDQGEFVDRREKAKVEADGIIQEARASAERETEIIRQSIDSVIKEKEAALGLREQGLQERERLLTQQLESISCRELSLDGVRERLSQRQEELDHLSGVASDLAVEWRQKLSELAGLSVETARKRIMEVAELEGKQEAHEMGRRIVEKAKRESESEARRIIGLAIQRYAGNHTSETTTAAVALKGDDIKGRIIGREGRNIRAFENATGMTVLIDDTPNAVVLSGFDPVRREIARESMERLIADGRIHPTRIEEVVERVKSEIDDKILKVAEEAVYRLNLAPVHEEIAKRLGRLYFRLSYSQNVLDHSIEVSKLAGLMAAEIGANVTDTMRAGLMHDVGKALGDDMASSHAIAGAEFIRRHGENDAVVNGVASHHDEIEHETVIGLLVSAADAISAARPGARLEPITAYINRLKNLEELGMTFEGVERCFAIQAGREVRVFVTPEKVTDEAASKLAKEVCRKIEDELQYPGQIRVTVIREVRCIDYAK